MACKKDLQLFISLQKPFSELLEEIKSLRQTAQAVKDSVKELGLTEDNYLIEFPGVGYHVWFFFEDYIPASTAARFLAQIERVAGIGPVVYKPSLKPIAPESFGEAVWLPLRLNDNTNRHSVFIEDWELFDPANYDPTPNFRTLSKIKLIPISIVNEICATSY